MGIRKYLNNQNWNIGFVNVTPNDLIRVKTLPKVKWMKHPYKDRFFADPFILHVDENSIYVLAEELIFGEKGTLVCLIVDRKSFKLKERKLLLQIDTHLSYPQIVRGGESVYIIPENSESGKLTAYRLDENNLTLTPVGIIAEEPLTDATLLSVNDEIYMVATKIPKSSEDAYLYKYSFEDKEFLKVNPVPIIKDPYFARMGGAFFRVNGCIFRPAQDCKEGYGKAITICQVKSIAPTYSEQPLFKIEPKSWRYNLGLHTLNFDAPSGLAVIDSYGYLYPVIGRVLMAIHKIKRLVKQ